MVSQIREMLSNYKWIFYYLLGTIRAKRSHNHPSKKLNKNSVFTPNHWSVDSMEQLSSSEIESKLLGSKLRNWMLQSNSALYSSYKEIFGVSKDENMESPENQCKSVGCGKTMFIYFLNLELLYYDFFLLFHCFLTIKIKCIYLASNSFYFLLLILLLK